MKHKEKRNNLDAIEEWKQEIKEKGDKAKDLSTFVMSRKERKQQMMKKRPGNYNSNNKGVDGATKRITKKSYGGRQSYQKHETSGPQKQGK